MKQLKEAAREEYEALDTDVKKLPNMSQIEIIMYLFPKNYKARWNEVFDYMFCSICPFKLDEALIDEYGEYEGSLLDHLSNTFKIGITVEKGGITLAHKL